MGGVLPYTNRGVPPTSKPSHPSFICDWYTCTIRQPPNVIMDALKPYLLDDWSKGPPRAGFNRAARSLTHKINISWHSDPHSKNRWPSVLIPGSAPADEFYLHVRKHFPEHYVSRVDAAYDFVRPDGWEWMVEVCSPLFFRYGSKRNFHGERDPLITKGRTVEFGSRTSRNFVRAYEKGKKAIHDPKSGMPDADPDWCRFEVEYKPDNKPSRFEAASMPISSIFGKSPWISEAINVMTGVTVSYTPPHHKKKVSYMSSFHHMLQQYGPVMAKVYHEIGAEEFHKMIDVAVKSQARTAPTEFTKSARREFPNPNRVPVSHLMG